MKIQLISLVITAVYILLADIIWLSSMVNTFYRKQIGHLLADTPNYIAAGAFYLLYVLGVSYFVIWPALQTKPGLGSVFITGALLGLLCYGTYDLTSQAVNQSWPTTLTIVDMIWGAFLTGSASLVTYYLVTTFIQT